VSGVLGFELADAMLQLFNGRSDIGRIESGPRAAVTLTRAVLLRITTLCAATALLTS